MNAPLKSLVLAATVLVTSSALAQTKFGIKVGPNYAIGSQKIQPEPKDPPTNPKGLGLMFGAYSEIAFSDMVGIRPELCFSFRRFKTESTQNQTFGANDGATLGGQPFQGTQEIRTEIDQRLNYFQLNAPLMITPSEGLRVMVGPSFGFLMGGKQNTDITSTIKGTAGNQNVDQEAFETSEKKGSSAVKDFRKMDVAAMAGVGYTLDAGLDLDLRFYRSIVTTFDESQGSSRQRVWTNLVEFAVGWTFGG